MFWFFLRRTLVIGVSGSSYSQSALFATEPLNFSIQIRLKSDQPIYSRPCRLSFEEKKQVQDMVTDLLKSGCIRPSNSQYASPIALVKKKSGDIRMWVFDQIHLTVVDAFDGCSAFKQILDKAKHIVTWAKQTGSEQSRLQVATGKRLIQSVVTRWNSDFDMLVRFVEIRTDLGAIMTNTRSAGPRPPLSDFDELDIIKYAIEVLTSTIQVNAENTVTPC